MEERQGNSGMLLKLGIFKLTSQPRLSQKQTQHKIRSNTMKLTLTHIVAAYALARTAAGSKHSFQSCWLIDGTTTNEQTCWDVDVQDKNVGICSKAPASCLIQHFRHSNAFHSERASTDRDLAFSDYRFAPTPSRNASGTHPCWGRRS